MRRTSSATLELPEGILVMLSFHFLFTMKPTPACPLLASELYSRWPLWRIVKISSLLRSPITSHFFRFFFQFLHTSVHFFSNVLTLYVSIFGRSPLVWWFFLTHRFLAPPVCSLGGPEPPHRLLGDRYPCCWGLGPWHICTLHAGFSWPTLPRWPMRVGRRYGNWSTKPR